MNMVILSIYDSAYFSGAILITDLNAKKFKCVESDNEDFHDEINRIYNEENFKKPFEMFDYFEKLFDERVDRILCIDNGSFYYDYYKANSIIQEMSRNAIGVREIIFDEEQKTVDTRIVIKPENRISKFKSENER